MTVDLVDRLAAAVARQSQRRKRVLVGIDGPDAAGKTTLADRLAEFLLSRGSVSHGSVSQAVSGAAVSEPSVSRAAVLRASVDGFHLPREVRYRRGELSPEGYYLDSFDYPALLARCLLPFRDGAAEVRTAAYDHRSDTERATPATGVPPRAILVMDGVFLLREQLRELWTLSVYLRVSPAETLRRAGVRDAGLFGPVSETRRRYLSRYLPGQALYRADAAAEAAAHVVVENERVDRPLVVHWRPPAG